jgi:hypothetical protein
VKDRFFRIHTLVRFKANLKTKMNNDKVF